MRDKRLFVREVEAALSLREHNQSVISAAHALLLSLGSLEEWGFCTAAYLAVIKFLRRAHVFISRDMCMDIKCFFFFFGLRLHLNCYRCGQ